MLTSLVDSRCNDVNVNRVAKFRYFFNNFFPIIMRFLLIVVLFNGLTAQNIIKFGALFNEDDIESIEIFDISISRQNAFNNKFRLEPNIKKIASMDSFEAEQAVCEMIENGAVAIIGPKSLFVSDVVASICNELNIPHIVSHQNSPELKKNDFHRFTRNIFPDTKLLSDALRDILKNLEWTKFGIIYDSKESLIRLDSVIQMLPAGQRAITVYKLPAKEYVRSFLKVIQKSHINRVIVDCNVGNIMEIIKQGLKVEMMGDYMSYLITSLDGHMVNSPELKLIRSNITAIRLMSPIDTEAMNIINQWKEKKKYLNAEQLRVRQQISNVSYDRLKAEAALIRDSITLLSNALKERRLYETMNTPLFRCSSLESAHFNDTSKLFWKKGREILENIDSSVRPVLGITGNIRFDEVYKTRTDFHMDLVELEKTEMGFRKIAEWNAYDRLKVTRSTEEFLSQKATNIQNKEFTVVTKLDPPYLAAVTNSNGIALDGNDRYEGFVKDLMDEIAARKNFKYKFVVEEIYGQHDKEKDKWTGMIGQILEGKADLGICDFTITHERRQVIDFSEPFMTLGIGILFLKPKKEPPPLLNFMRPLSTAVWLYMSTAFLFVCIVLYFLAKITEADWENPHPCADQPEELENIWNMHNCIWLAGGSIMQQGCDILPKGIPTRLAAALWWFFALIIIASYTANLTAFLTKDQIEATIENVEDLAKESKIKYGCLAGGATETFFRDSNVSTYQKMWAKMEHADPTVFVQHNNEGIERVKKTKYAFLMESASIEYTIKKECSLTRIGGLLDSKAYGIGMPMNSPFREDINAAILLLKEDRTVQNLRDKWWITKNQKTVNCLKESEEKSENPDLDWKHVSGVFLVLLVGVCAATLIGILEFFWNVRKVSVAQKITPYEAFRREFMFACKVWIAKKPIPSLVDIDSTESLTSEESAKANGCIEMPTP